MKSAKTKSLTEQIYLKLSMIVTHIPNRKNFNVKFSFPVCPDGKLGKSYENMKISKCFKSSCIFQIIIKIKNDVNWTFPLPTEKIILVIFCQ